jgi:hypothetical protein
MTENAIIAICTGVASLLGWSIKIILRVEKRLTRIETRLGTEDDTTVFIKKHK